MRILLQSGADAPDIPGVTVVPFVDDMPGAFADADLVICRAGAGAVAELAAAGKPAILVPYPYAADDHQAKNAAALERTGAARMVLDRECTPERLVTLWMNAMSSTCAPSSATVSPSNLPHWP